MTSRPASEIQAELAAASADDLPHLIDAYRGDERQGVRAAVTRAQRRLAREIAELHRLHTLAAVEWELMDGGCFVVAGVDEVGRGALAGPVTACACVFDRQTHVRGVDDSKRLSPATRVRLAEEIRAMALGVAVAHVDPLDIDRMGIAAATVLAMRTAIDGLPSRPDHVLVDGLPVDVGHPCTAIVKGDSSTRCIAAASIVAKVARDRLMGELELQYPGYGFARHKGYGSAEHIDAISRLGPSPVHRMSFAPCASRRLF